MEGFTYTHCANVDLGLRCQFIEANKIMQQLINSQFLIKFKRFNWSKNNFGEIHISQRFDWAFSFLSHYFL